MAQIPKKDEDLFSHSFSFENQVIHRLASIEAVMDTNFKHMNEKFDRYQTDTHDKFINLSTEVGELRGKLEAKSEHSANERQKIKDALALKADKEETESRLDGLESFKTQITSKVVGGILVIGAVWAIVGESIGAFIGRLF